MGHPGTITNIFVEDLSTYGVRSRGFLRRKEANAQNKKGQKEGSKMLHRGKTMD